MRIVNNTTNERSVEKYKYDRDIDGVKIVKTTVKERVVGGKYKYKRIYISTDPPIDAEPGKEVELVIMTREEWARYQEEMARLREELEDYLQLVASQLDICHRVVQLAALQLRQAEGKMQQPPAAVEPPQPQPIAVEIQQSRRRRSRRQLQQTEQRQQMEQRQPSPPSQMEPLTVPTELRERLLQNQWVKILRERQ